MIGSSVFWRETCKVGKFWKIFGAKIAPKGVKLKLPVTTTTLILEDKIMSIWLLAHDLSFQEAKFQIGLFLTISKNLWSSRGLALKCVPLILLLKIHHFNIMLLSLYIYTNWTRELMSWNLRWVRVRVHYCCIPTKPKEV